MDEPVLPSWAVSVNVPIAQETFVLGEELTNDSTIIVQGADSLIFLAFDGDLDTMQISASEFNLGGIQNSQSFEVGSIQLNNLDPLRADEVSLGVLLPELQNNVVPNQTVTVPIPDTTLAPSPQTLASQQFEALHVSSGQFLITINNDLPLAIGPNTSQPEGLSLLVVDDDGTTVAQFSVGQVIAPRSSIRQTVPLTGGDTWIRAPFTISYLLPIVAGQSIDLNQDVLDSSSVSFSVTLEQLAVNEAIAVLEPQTFERRLLFPLESEHRLKEAGIAEGQIALNFQNNTGVDVTIGFTATHLRDPQLGAFSDSIFVAAQSSNQFDLVLNNFRLIDFENPGSFLDSLAIDYIARTAAQQQMVHLKSSDSISVNIALDSLQLNTFEGFVIADTFRMEPFTESNIFDYQDIPTNISLQNVNLSLTLVNEFTIENLQSDIRISGYHVGAGGVVEDSATIVLDNQSVTSGTIDEPGVSVIQLNGNDVAEFINIFPTRIKTSGQVRVSGNVAVANNCSIRGSFSFATPLKFQIDGEARFSGDEEVLTEEDIDQDIQDAAEENLEEGALRFSLLNHTPIGGTLRLIVSNDASHPNLYQIDNPDPAREFIKEFVLSAASVNPVTGFVDNSVTSAINVQLTQSELQLFQQPPLRVGYELILDATSGTVAIRASDFVTIGGLATIRVKIDE